MGTDRTKGKDTDEAVKEALKQGRNATDNFQDGEVDDYGTDSQEELEERQAIKGGQGQHGKERNRNDDFNEDKPE